ncbi:MAG: KpsF/GutQ family sugar-phosphate isomerase [Betaproteobacteria bacterium]|nr:KpsF/GutQ family sugar-phosphate isomerase [Betaproteobacteria bacterium]
MSALATGREVLAAECAAIAAVRDGLGDSFERAVALLLACKGKAVCTGVGKSGHIARKAAATLASTGAPAFYMHPSEAGHGDVGVLSGDDILLALSHSGESAEILDLLPAARRRGVKIIAVCGAADSTLAQAAAVALIIRVEREACPLNLAPTASTTAALALTDALAVALFSARGFSADDFAMSHPSGALGRRLLLRVSDIMRRDGDVPLVESGASFTAALVEMSGKRMGMVLVADGGELRGIFTDGDLRRAVAAGADLSKTAIADLMTAAPRTVSPEILAADALNIMRENRLNHLAAVENGKLAGALSFHDMLAHRLI